KSTRPSSKPIGGMMMPSTSEVIIFPKATAMIRATARSITLPRSMNSLNSLNIRFSSRNEAGAGDFVISHAPVFLRPQWINVLALHIVQPFNNAVAPALPGGRAALVIAHPGHELRVYHWLRLARPSVFILTDG